MAIRTVTICRECDKCEGAGEVEFDVDVDGEYEPADPEVGIMSGGYTVNGAVLAGTKTEIELTEEEIKTISEEAEQEYSDDAEEDTDD